MDYFRTALDELKQAAQHLVASSGHLNAAHQEIVEAGAALVRTTERMVDAHGEQEDLRETVARLERLVLELVEERRKRTGQS